MRIWFDTEFIEDGKTIDLLSIGLVREDGHYYYAENVECDRSKAGPWVKENVLPHLTGENSFTRADIATDIRKFAGTKAEFWAYYADYDWVTLCQLYGTMMDLPHTWPMFCRDVKQLCIDRGNPRLPENSGRKHHALDDARWAMKAWEFLSARPEALQIDQSASNDLLNNLAVRPQDTWTPQEVSQLFLFACGCHNLIAAKSGQATEDGPLGGFAPVGPAAIELDFMLTQFQNELQAVMDDATSVEDSCYHDAEALKLRRQIIDRFAPSPGESNEAG